MTGEITEVRLKEDGYRYTVDVDVEKPICRRIVENIPERNISEIPS